MQYGDDSIFEATGLRIPPKQLELIGIGPQSVCWGMWLPDWVGASTIGDARSNRSKYPDHFVISPFHPDVWLCLLHITVKLDDRQGTANAAIAVLRDAGVNILSHHMTQTGHHHATLSLIGTIPAVFSNTGDFASVLSWRMLPRNDRSISSREVRKRATRDIAQPILRRIVELEERFRVAHDSEPFLRSRFVVPQTASDTPCGLAFDPTFLDPEIKERSLRQMVSAVNVHWLQYPAFAWLYGGTGDPVRLQFDADDAKLVVDVNSSDSYLEGLLQLVRAPAKPPIPAARAVTCIDAEARCARVMPSRAADGEPWLIWVEYRGKTARSRPGSSSGGSFGSQGLLYELTSALKNAQANLWHMSNQILEVGDGIERGRIRFWITQSLPSERQRPKESGDWIADVVKALDDDRIARRDGVTITRISPECITPYKAFVSTKFEWWKGGRGSNISEVIVAELRGMGLEPEISMGRDSARRGGPRRDALTKIARCQGFLQVIPKKEGHIPKGGLEWLTFELGIALSAGLPCVVLCDSKGKEIAQWKERYKGLIDELYIDQFDSFASDESIRSSVQRALKGLAHEIHGRYSRGQVLLGV